MKVTIESDRSRLRLRWLYQGKRVNLSLGVNDNPTGRAVAKMKAGQIETDLMAGHYDETLLRYKPRKLGKCATELSTPELFGKWTTHISKEKGLAPRSVETRYKPLESALKKYLDIPADEVSEVKARNFAAICIENLTPNTAKARLWLLQSCWDWAAGKYHVATDNPWKGLAAKVKGESTKRVKPFSQDEIKRILEGFRTDRYYSFYYDLVRFLFGVGCRPGEAFALRWGNVADDFSYATIKASVSRGHARDTTKTGKSRMVHFSPGLQEMMRDRYQQKKPKPSDLVFPSRKGLVLNDLNFRDRAWKTVLGAVGVEYRSPYAIRHSAGSHAYKNGANPAEIAEQMGHSLRVCLDTYVKPVQQRSLFVEF